MSAFDERLKVKLKTFLGERDQSENYAKRQRGLDSRPRRTRGQGKNKNVLFSEISKYNGLLPLHYSLRSLS